MIKMQQRDLVVLFSQDKKYCIKQIKKFSQKVKPPQMNGSYCSFGKIIFRWKLIFQKVFAKISDENHFPKCICIQQDHQCIVH